LFLDEPTAGLDPESRRRTRELIRDVLAAGSTVVLTTHYLEEAEELADRLAIMHRGRIVRGGTPAEVAASQPARISFTQPPAGSEPLPALPGCVVPEPGRTTMVLRTGNLQQTLTALLNWADRHQITLRDLVARPASLEQVFLAVAQSGDDPAAPAGTAIPGEVAA
jgi:ABC-2 type transport system ATP-binding protein